MTKFKEIDKIAQDFLEKIALECYRKKQNASLMKFVRAFSTMENKRRFLKSLDCLEELLILEEESGNFNEAADIAKRLGDILREVDLLEKGKDFVEASLLLVCYVLSNSLWLTRSQGWPLKSFPQKDQLLTKSMSIAQKVSGDFHASICAEAHILNHEQSNLSELLQCYYASKQYKTHTGEILTVRKLLDAHFQAHPAKYEWDFELHIDPRFVEKISRNQVSCIMLVYVWSLWKSHVLEILDCLDSLDGLDNNKCEGTVQFCLNYFGVRLQNNSQGTYILLKPDAAWIVNADKRFIVRNRKVVTLEARHFASATKKYWRQELISVGFRVLEALQALHKHSVTRPLSKYGESMCLTCIYDVARFFIESNSLDIKKGDERRLQDFLRLSSKYFEIVFPLDSRLSLSENLLSLRETEISRSALEEIISRNISKGNELTHGQIGRVVMIMLGSGKQRVDLYERISERFGKNSCWKIFIDNLCGIESSNSADLSLELNKALEECFYARLRVKDCISPNCFLYLVERLLVLIPKSEGFFFTTKSAFVEYFVSLPSDDANPSACFVTDDKFYSTNIFRFIVSVVQECLYNHQETAGWIRRSWIDCKYYFPVMMLRLFVIKCLLCLNSDLSFNMLFEMLDAPQIRSLLPREFCDAIIQRRWNNYNKYNSYVASIARAFEAIGNPLVIVSASSVSRPKFVCPGAVFLELKSFSCRNEIMKTLFPNFERKVVKSCGIELPPVVTNQSVNNILQSETKTDTNMSPPESGKRSMQINWGFIQEMSEAVESHKNSDDEDEGKLKSLVLKKKVEVEEHMNFLTCAVAQFNDQKRSHSGEDINELREATEMIEDLNRICSILDTGGNFDFKALSKIGEVLKSLEARRLQLDTLLNQDPNRSDVVVSGGIDDDKISDSVKRTTEDRKTEDSSERAAESSQRKGKGKKNKKPKKGRGRGK